jgi:pyruvate-formate lyase-activating enzyme
MMMPARSKLGKHAHRKCVINVNAKVLAEAAVRSDCRSVAFTYSDPVIFMEYALQGGPAA